MTRLFLLVFCAGILCFHADVRGQKRKYAYQQLKEDHGLPQNFVYGLVQDDRGFLWAGTGTGLSRYDGNELKVFGRTDSLSSDFVTTAFRSATGKLIFGHNQGGLTMFDGLQFRRLLADTLDNKIVSIAEGENNILWIATQQKGLLVLDQATGKFTSVFPEQLGGQIINVIFRKHDMLWVGTNEGLFLFRINSKTLEHIEADPLPPYVEVTSVVPHSSDSSLTWVGTAFEGLFLLKDVNTRKKILVLNNFELTGFTSETIQDMAQDVNGDLWIGTRQNGVLHINFSGSGRRIFKINHFGKSSGFPFTSVNKLIVDRQGQIWASTMGDGLVKIYKQSFIYLSFTDFGVTEVRSITETVSGYLVATDKGLLRIRLNTESDEYEVETFPALRNEPVLSVFTDSRNTTWVGSENKGVFVIPYETGKIVAVPVDKANDPLEIRLFEEDNKGNIWMSARAEGIYVLSKERTLVRHLTTANKFIHNDIFAIKADSKGNIWFGAYGAGLAMLDQKGTLQLLSKQDSLRARDINDIDEDGAGNIWIATEGDGFFKYADKKFTQVGSSENLVSPFIKGIHFDPAGRVWFSFRKGLGYFDLKSEKKYNFSTKDGLLANEAYSSVIIVDSKSNKWFCNDYGVTLFEHDSIADEGKELLTYLTGLRIFFKARPGELQKDTGQGLMAGTLPSVELPHDQNHITFDFVAVKLNRASKIYYRHLLEGYDSDWTPPKTETYVTYTNLDPGKYVLKVQATDDLGSWVDPVTEYAFTITPPFWRRTWFYLLQIISVLTLFVLTYFIGRKTIATKRYVLRLMLFSSFFITLEYVENFIDPLVPDIFGGAPVFRFFLNFLLALLLLPVETIITHWLMDDEQIPAATAKIPPDISGEREVYEEQNMEATKD
ncbi:MAG: two-component regulator propeller domain-containing protein [Chryseosolibacter sp.]